ncbi:hypothetical protein [Demequina sp. NBRC 110054]|uniref:hypothetical protein n=1 Tax=Demequina sp. NBRC 110054 TaxID=1570343 RepID=UPI001177E6CC|nr:hypothetical protein [Demequina sp. NBRC 110054]
MTTWVPLLVPLEDYAELADLVAAREAHRGERPVEVRDVAVEVDGAPRDPDDVLLEHWVPWSVGDLATLAEGASKTAERWARAMDACTEAVNSGHHWLSTSEVAERTGMTINEWRDAPRKITRHLRANYPNVPVDKDGHKVWPLLAKSKPGSQEIHWAINGEQAKRWRAVREAQR